MAIFNAYLWKVPGPPELLAVVWQQLWPVLKQQIVTLFQASINSRQFPLEWKVARIIPLKKPDKDDSIAKTYRPISFLSSLGKALEAVVATCLSYFAEKFNLLLPNHFSV